MSYKNIAGICTILMYCCISCNTTPEKTTPQADADPNLRAQALRILDHRIKNDPNSYAIMEAGYLMYQFVFNGREMSKPGEHDGDWIDFKPDFTYDYGNYDATLGKGKYHYSMEKNQLVMLDNDKKKGPQEWDVKTGGDVVILIGTKTYGNNAFQMKLERSDTLPSK